MKAEHRAFARFERHDEPDAVAILGHMADPQEPLHVRVALGRRHRLAVDQDLARAQRPDAGERLEQLRLAVAGDAGHAKDFAFAQ